LTNARETRISHFGPISVFVLCCQGKNSFPEFQTPVSSNRELPIANSQSRTSNRELTTRTPHSPFRSARCFKSTNSTLSYMSFVLRGSTTGGAAIKARAGGIGFSLGGISGNTVRHRGMGTGQMGTILTFASVPLRKMGTDLLGSWWP